jgi:hypothetical protein
LTCHPNLKGRVEREGEREEKKKKKKRERGRVLQSGNIKV